MTMRVEDVMTRAPVACGPDSPLAEIARLMVEHDCGLIPVIDEGEVPRPIGVVSDRDIVCRAVAVGRNPLELRARDVMTASCITITPEQPLDECLQVMESMRIRRVIVVGAGGEICGIVAQADVARHGGTKQTAEVVRAVSVPSEAASQVHV